VQAQVQFEGSGVPASPTAMQSYAARPEPGYDAGGLPVGTAPAISGSAHAAAKASRRRRMSRPSSHAPMRSAIGASQDGRIVKL
jgi:hypothetical protein